MPLATVLRVVSAPVPGGLVHAAIVTVPEEDGREVRVELDEGDVPRVTEACFDGKRLEVVSDGAGWRLARTPRG